MTRKCAVVTGGARGIGLAIVRALAAQGCKVIVTGRNAASLKSLESELGKQVTGLKCDVRRASDTQRLAREVERRFHSLDFLINNAGIAHSLKDVDRLGFREWRDVIETNLTGLFLVTHALLPRMIEGSVIVNNLSIASEQVFAGMSAYNASKFGALGFTGCLREELRPRGIRVTALIAGATDTDIWDQFWPDAPRSKMLKPATVARAVLAALMLPSEARLDVLRITPTAGTL